MSNQPPRRIPKATNRYGPQQPPPSMATPRLPEPSNKIGFMGIVFMLAILAGVTWLAMVVFGWGPYQKDRPLTTVNPDAMLFNTTDIPSFGIVLTTPDANTIATQGPVLQEPSPTLLPSATPEILPFDLDGEPDPVPSVMIRPKLGCDWLVIAGQVWDLQGSPLVGLKVHLFGELSGYAIDTYALTGADHAIAYGESGFEFALEGMVTDSDGSLQIQLVDADGIPLSNAYKLQTFNNCQQNLILVNFKQVR